MRVEVLDRQFLHLGEQFPSYGEQHAVGHPHHQLAVGQDAQDARQIQRAHRQDGVQQPGEIPGARLFHGLDEIVDDHAQK